MGKEDIKMCMLEMGPAPPLGYDQKHDEWFALDIHCTLDLCNSGVIPSLKNYPSVPLGYKDSSAVSLQ